MFHQLDVFGLIDKDRRTEKEINSLEENGVFVLMVAEVENLFATSEILQILATNQGFDFNEKFTEIKRFVISELKNELDVQISQRMDQELRHILNKSDLNGKTKDEVKTKYTQLIDPLVIDKIYDDIKNTFNNIISNEDYEKLLSFYNRKNIASRIGAIFELTKGELPELIIRLSKNKTYAEDFKIAINKYLPIKLVNIINKSDDQQCESVDEK